MRGEARPDSVPDLVADRRLAQARQGAVARLDPRVQRSRDRALEAARTVLLSEGWDALSQQRVAEVAGIGRATVYRLWPDRIELLHDVCVLEMQTVQTVPTGDLAADLGAQIEMFRAELVDRHFDAVLIPLVDRGRFEPLLQEIKALLVRSGTESLRRRIAGAIEDGELAADLDLDEAVAALVAPLVYRHVFAEQEVSAETIRRTVSDFLTLRAPRPVRSAPTRRSRSR